VLKDNLWADDIRLDKMRSYIFVAAAILTFAAGAQALPKDAVIHDLKSSADGTLYAAGAMDGGGFVAQLPSNYLYRTAFPVDRIALGWDGSVFATGTADGGELCFFVSDIHHYWLPRICSEAES